MFDFLNNLPGDSLLQKVDFFERNYDRQYKSLKKIVHSYPDKIADISFGVIQDALVSFQLSGKGEDWHEEFATFMIDNFDLFLDDNFSFWKRLLTEGKYNRRLLNLKLSRIKKTLVFKQEIVNNWVSYYRNMVELNKLIAFYMNQSLYAKTVVFSIKLFSYTVREIEGFIPFPFEISIPVDSRIKRKYFQFTGKQGTDSQVRKYFFELGKSKGIPPLHLDSLLWVEGFASE